MSSGFKPNRNGLQKMQRELNKELKRYPVQVPVEAEVAGGGTSRGGGGLATGSELGLVIGWIIDWLYEYAKIHPSLIPAISEVMTELGVEDQLSLVEQHVDVAFDSLGERGLIDEAKTYGSRRMNRSARLTDSGREEAVTRIERRSDTRTRRGACRDAVLRWVYDQDANGGPTDIAGISHSPYGWFNGVLFNAADLVGAIQYLRERRLLGGTDETLIVEPAGIECVEQYGGVVEYLNRADRGGVNVTIMGNNSGQLAVANRDVDQHQTNTDEGQVLAVFAEALREFARLLPEEQHQEYETVASGLEREAAKEKPDKGWIHSLFQRAKGLLEGAPANVNHLAQVVKIGFEIYGQN